jgi:hypothetical protein
MPIPTMPAAKRAASRRRILEKGFSHPQITETTKMSNDRQ